MTALSSLACLFILFAAVVAQSCDNLGVASGTSCICPPGFGGANCSSVACGGNIFQGSSRKTIGPSQGNLTASGCTCDNGWTGLGCNVCQTASACQSGYGSTSSGQSSSATGNGNGVTGSDVGQNDTLVCNTASRVWAAGEMSCAVVNPTLQAIYSGQTTLNILRTYNASLTPIPNVTAAGASNTVSAQLFYVGVEQFFCGADTCVQDTQTGNGSSSWQCQNLKCKCIPGTTFCGAVPSTDLTNTIDALTGALTLSCDNGSSCLFQQSMLDSLFGSSGLALSSCTFGECVRQSVIDGTAISIGSPSSSKSSLNGGVIAGLAVVGGLIALVLLFFIWGWISRRKAVNARSSAFDKSGGVGVDWAGVSYIIPGNRNRNMFGRVKTGQWAGNDDKVILDNLSGHVEPGQMMAILGPSGAGKTTLVEILASKSKSGIFDGAVTFPSSASGSRPKIGFVPQQDILPSTLTVYEALLFACRLRLPENVPDLEKRARVEDVMHRLGIESLRDVRIGNVEKRGISGGEMRRVSIGLELVARPDVLILDEPTSGLDSVSAARVANVLQAVARDPDHPTTVIASIHQPSSQLYHKFDRVLVLSHGRALYNGPGGFAPSEYLVLHGIPYQQGYNVADHLLEVASDPPVALFQQSRTDNGNKEESDANLLDVSEKGGLPRKAKTLLIVPNSGYATTFLTQLETLCGREWKTLRRDKTLFLSHVLVSAVLGVFCGGLYYKTGITIAGFQSRVGCLFFLGSLIAFSSLSALYNIVEIRPLFMRERSSLYYSPTAWLLSRFIFDVVPLRILPTIIVSTVTYWMAGLAGEAAHFFKFLFILVLYTLVMTLWNFLLGCFFRNGGIAILISALSALYQMTFAGFFVHLNSIPPVLRWLQWLCPLKATLEALSVNEVGSGLMIVDTLEGVPISLSASLLMNLLFGFTSNAYYRDVLVLFAYIAVFTTGVVGVVWLKVRERR